MTQYDAMVTRLLVLVFVVIVRCECLVYETSGKPGSEENEECRREGGNIWLCKKVTECPTTKTILLSGDSLQTCSWKDANTHLICCPPDNVTDHQSLTESVSQEKCSEYQALLCKNGVYKAPSNRLPQEVQRNRNTRETFHIEVFGGTLAKPASHPYMALVGYGDETAISWQCGGSLISNRFVLSAAHCSDTSYGPARWVRLGDLDIVSVSDDARPQLFEIKERIAHRGYKAPAYYNDIVLFMLDRRVVFDEYVGPVCLHHTLGELEGNGIATGWGRNESNGPRSAALQEVTLKFIPKEKCKLAVGVVKTVLPQGIDGQTMLCAGEPGKDTCQGDSGGPLTLAVKDAGCLATQVGVTSFGPRFCGETNVPGTYVKVAYFLPWIESIVWPMS